MFRIQRLIPVLLIALAVHAATLRQLSMDQLTQGATTIVRAKIVGASASVYASPGGSTIYTHYKLAVSEVWKGETTREVTLPGGDANGQKQSFPGVPELHVGGEYVLYLWKSPSTGIIHTMGLTQGIFEVTTQADGTATVSRRQSGELMLDATGHRVADHSVHMDLLDMKTRVSTTGSAVK